MEICLTEKKISADISVPVEAGGMICSSFPLCPHQITLGWNLLLLLVHLDPTSLYRELNCQPLK